MSFMTLDPRSQSTIPIVAIATLLIAPISSADQDITTELVARVKSAVVIIDAFDTSGQRLSTGSGFFISNSQIVTIYHVLEDATSAKVRLATGQSCDVRTVVASSQWRDLIIIEIAEDGPAHLKPAREESKMGQHIFIIGAPLGLEFSVSDGLVSGIRKLKLTSDDWELQPLLQLSAPISPGSSGSPVIDKNGHYVGVVRSSLASAHWLNFAIPADTVMNLRRNKPVLLAQWCRDNQKRSLKSALGLINIPMILHYFPLVPIDDLDQYDMTKIARCLLTTGDYTESVLLLRASISKTTDDFTRKGLEEMILLAQRRDKAEANARQKYIKNASLQPIPQRHTTRGLTYFINGQYWLANEAFRAALRRNPAEPGALFAMGLAYMRLDRIFDARDAFVKLSKLKPMSPKGHLYSGILYTTTKQYVEAQQAFDAYTKLRPHDAGGFEALGSVSAIVGDWTAAEIAYRSAARLDPSKSNYRLKLGVIYLAQGKLDQAREEAESQSSNTENQKYLEFVIAEHCRKDGLYQNLSNEFKSDWILLGIADPFMLSPKALLLMGKYSMENAQDK